MVITIDFGTRERGVSQIHLTGVDDRYADAIAEYLRKELRVEVIRPSQGRLSGFRHEGSQHFAVRVLCTPAQVMPFATRVENDFWVGSMWGLPQAVRDIYVPPSQAEQA